MSPEVKRLVEMTLLERKSDTNSDHLCPSRARSSGRPKRKERMVVRANWLPTDPIRSLRPGVSISFLFSFALKAAKRLAVHAAMSADHAKSSSLTEASTTPPMTGMSASHLAVEMDLPYTAVETTAAKAGSAAFTICPNETAPAERAKTLKQWAPIAQKPTGSILTRSSLVTDGTDRESGAAHMYSAPTPSCSTPIVIGKPAAPPAALRHCLFAML